MKSLALLVLALVVLAVPILSQAPAGGRPQFDVASIKVHPPPITRIIIQMPPGRFLAEAFNLKMLVGQAYGVPESRVVGGPGWVESDRFDAGPFGGGPMPRGAFTAGRGNIQSSATPISNFVNFLVKQLGRPVYDKTGITGLYDIKLEWTPGTEQVPGPFGPNPDAPPPAPDTAGPSLFTALQEQLGLRLESTRGPAEVVVIDSAQKPAEN